MDQQGEQSILDKRHLAFFVEGMGSLDAGAGPLRASGATETRKGSSSVGPSLCLLQFA